MRLVFHGPPLEILKLTFAHLTAAGGVSVPGVAGQAVNVPVLLQISPDNEGFANPPIGASGLCDETYLLTLRNLPSCPRYIALVPPGQHLNLSISSTTDEFGVAVTSNSANATFDDWWGDHFVQQVISRAIAVAGLQEQETDARGLIAVAARAFDEVDPDRASRQAAWSLLSRVFAVGAPGLDLPRSASLSLACGFPPLQGDSLSSHRQVTLLARLADAMGDGFKLGVERAKQNADSNEELLALDEFLAHILSSCEVPTAFERATPAFYSPAAGLEIKEPPNWWIRLTVERWEELLDEQVDAQGDLSLECMNSLVPQTRGTPSVVWSDVELLASTGTHANLPLPAMLERRCGGGDKGLGFWSLALSPIARHNDAAAPSHRAPIRYRLEARDHKDATLKVISLETWHAGVFVSCRSARKLIPPKAAKKGNREGIDWDTSIWVAGAGRYDLHVFLGPLVNVDQLAIGQSGDANDLGEGRAEIPVRMVSAREHAIEIEADGEYQVDVTLVRDSKGGPVQEVLRVHFICEEVVEEGCRSEFERLIRLNRQHLERVEGKSVVQIDRHVRCGNLQAWMLDDRFVGRSFGPVVVAEDYAHVWLPPNWSSQDGPILSRGRFLHDPRPTLDELQPPPKFLESRSQIAARIRGTDDDAGLVESAPLGEWIAKDPEFRGLVEAYLDAYMDWHKSDPDTACWVDVVAVTTVEADGRTLSSAPDAILLSPLHPLRLAWHCIAQQTLHEAVKAGVPCPAASVLDPDCVPDVMTIAVRAPDGIEYVNFLAVECNSDYWSVLWNGDRLQRLVERSKLPPFGAEFGITVGGISSGFSPAQVSRALDDVSDLLAAKPILSLVVSSAGGATDACNEGLLAWCARRFGRAEPKETVTWGLGPRLLQVFDVRPDDGSRPDEATIANLSEDTGGSVRWFESKPAGTRPDLGIIAQLDSAQPETTGNAARSPLSQGALIRHRVRRQLPGRTFLSESRQGLAAPASGAPLLDKVASCAIALENRSESRIGFRFAPNIHAIQHMLADEMADFAAVSSSSVDPACFLGGWLKGAYLWDYDLPSYSQRAGDTNGYYLLSQVKTVDREALRKVLSRLPGSQQLADASVDAILLEVARRGIPTVRGLSGDDTGATGDLGLFVTVRLLQDQFRVAGNLASLLPVIGGTPGCVSIAIIVPVDPFRGYLEDLNRSLKKDRRELSLSRPDLLVAGITITGAAVTCKLTPIEVKCRQGSTMSKGDCESALAQARSLSTLLTLLAERAEEPGAMLWRLALQHLFLSMLGFGFRVYSQHRDVVDQSARWSGYHEQVAAAILSGSTPVHVDKLGRLVVVDGSPRSEQRDCDGDGFAETIVIGSADAGRIVAGDPAGLYDAIRQAVGDWALLPVQTAVRVAAAVPLAVADDELSATGGVGDADSRVLHQDPANPLVPEASGLGEVVGGSIEPKMGTHAMTEGSVSPETDGGHPQGGGVLLSLGSTTGGFEAQAITLNVSDTRLNQLNIGVVGDLGTGKTQLLKSLIYQLACSSRENRGVSPRFLIFDYKKDYSGDDFVAAVGARVVKPYKLPINLFDTSTIGESAAPWLDRFRFFADVLDKIYSGIGPVQRDKLKQAVKRAYEACGAAGRQPTIYDIHAEYKALLGGKSDSPLAIIDDLVDMEIFTADPAEAQGFDKFLDGVVVISLGALGQDDRTKNMLVAVMLNMFYEYMLKIPKRPFQGSDPQLRVLDSYLLVDEADNIMRYEFDVLRKVLLQGREFGTGVILASQYLRHFKVNATDYREPLLTWFIHKVPNVTAAELGALGFTSDLGELVDRVKTLPNHQCLFKSFNAPGDVIRGTPFYELKRPDATR